MDTSQLYMFVDYDGVVKTYAENFPYELHDENMPSSMSMIRVLSNIAGLSGLPAYFMPISSSPGRLSKEELLTMFRCTYRVGNLELHPHEPVVPVRTERAEYVKKILKRYDVAYHLILDDEFHWYEGERLNYFQTHTFDGIRFETFLKVAEFAENIRRQNTAKAAP